MTSFLPQFGSHLLSFFICSFVLFPLRPSAPILHSPLRSAPARISPHQDLLHAYTQAQRAEFELQFAAQQLESCDDASDPAAQVQALEAYEVAAAEQV
jgi:hypothetical protein